MVERLNAPLDEFKARELEILSMMADGLSNVEIADKLFISKATVRWYNKQIYSKLGTSRRTEAIALAREMGLIGAQSPDPAPQEPQPAIRHQLPLTIGPFVGRERELGELGELLRQPDVRLLSIIAAGGMGKSRLSLEVGHRIQEDYAQGAVFIDLTPVRDPDDIVAFTLIRLGLEVVGSKSLEDVLIDYCREKALLLIFDNFEHVLGGVDLLARILQTAPKVTIIVTSRERLKLRAETIYPLEPVMAHGSTLFVEVANLMHPQIVFSDGDEDAIERVVRLVGGMPLALVIAATWADMLPVAEIAEEIQQSLDFLQAEMGDLPERQHSIRAVINPSWKRLTDGEQRAFMWASVFRGGFSHEMFRQVTGESLRTLQTLLNRSLVTQDYERRYDMHPLLRQYAREKLEAHQMLAAARGAHLTTFLSYAQTHAEQMDNGHYLASLDALAAEQDNFRAALDWSLEGNQIEQGVGLIAALGEFWLTRSQVREGADYIERALRHSDDLRLYRWLGPYMERLGKPDRERAMAEKLVAKAEAAGDLRMLAHGRYRLGLHVFEEHDNPAGRAAIREVLDIAEEVGDQRLIGICHNTLGNALSSERQENGLLDEVFAHYQQALAAFEALGDLRGISMVTNNIALNYYDQPEQRPQARDLMAYSLDMKRQIGDRAGVARRLATLSQWAIYEEDFERAQAWLSESRAISEAIGEQQRLAYALETEGMLHLIMTHFEQAEAAFEHAREICLNLRDLTSAVVNYSYLCHLHLLQRQPDKARAALGEGFAIAEREASVSPLLMLAYANYRWHTQAVAAAVRAAAVLTYHSLEPYGRSTKFTETYLFQPLVYRIERHIGTEAWTQAVEQAAGVTVEQLFEQVTPLLD